MALTRVAVSVYDHAVGLHRTLESIRAFLPDAYIVVVDGAYAQFPHVHPHSTDGTLDVARGLADTVIECPGGPWPSEIVKRNAYLQGTPDDRPSPGDLFLMIDADEEPRGTWPGFDGMDADVTFVNARDHKKSFPLYRVFRYEPGLEYRLTHYGLWVGSRCRNHGTRPTLSGFYLWHRNEYDATRREHRAGYYQWLQENERRHVQRVEGGGNQPLESVECRLETSGHRDPRGQAMKIVRFKGIKRKVYHGPDIDLTPGQTAAVEDLRAEELIRNFPVEFEIVNPDAPTPQMQDLTKPVADVPVTPKDVKPAPPKVTAAHITGEVAIPKDLPHIKLHTSTPARSPSLTPLPVVPEKATTAETILSAAKRFRSRAAPTKT